jgi:acetylornithine deacetylase/succinyl-diaminopimelate desuccinylase-like protein
MIKDEVNGMGPITELLSDKNITEIMVNGPHDIYVEIDGNLVKDESVSFINDQHIIRTIQRLIQPLGRTIDAANPMVDARLRDGSRLNAAKLITELLSEFPQGVFYRDETGVITSCNLGALVAGGIQNSVATIVENNIKTNNYIDEIMKKTSTNIINTLGMASYSIRSASSEKEIELKNLMSSIVDNFYEKYQGLAIAEINFEVHLLPFEKSNDSRIEAIHTKASEILGIKNEISSFHAGAETHIYCNNRNQNNEFFIPYLVGLADIYNMHSAEEKVDYKTIIKGYELLKNIFIEFNKE